MHSSDRREWIKCTPFAEGLVEGIFFAFKTPLERSSSFTVDSVMDYAKEKKWDLGFWIDLTASNKYYYSSNVQSHDLEYFKIPSTGKYGPPKIAVESFIRACDKFIKENPGKAIAVHCTNGFNRTGYMIAAYLAHSKRCTIYEALDSFAKGRPPGIYRQALVDNLILYYGDRDTRPAPKVSLAFWDNDYKEDGDGDGDGDDAADLIANQLGALGI